MNKAEFYKWLKVNKVDTTEGNTELQSIIWMLGARYGDNIDYLKAKEQINFDETDENETDSKWTD